MNLSHYSNEYRILNVLRARNTTPLCHLNDTNIYIYLNEIKADKKVSKNLLFNILRTIKAFLIIFIYININLYLNYIIRILKVNTIKFFILLLITRKYLGILISLIINERFFF